MNIFGNKESQQKIEVKSKIILTALTVWHAQKSQTIWFYYSYDLLGR